jgi:hypothetical protein
MLPFEWLIILRCWGLLCERGLRLFVAFQNNSRFVDF